MSRYGGDYTVDTVDMVDGTWREKDFSSYDVVFHVAGIAHSDNGKISEEKKKLYYRVNTDLTVETAKKAKSQGVGQFIFMSSAIVYGSSAPIGEVKRITKDTPVSPDNCYSDSKVLAEKGLRELEDDSFKVVILRPPMIYGKGSKGNYPLLSKIAQKLPFFPNVKNNRSMLYIENLCQFVKIIIDKKEKGVFFPANKEVSTTSLLVKQIALVHGKRLFLVKGFSWLFRLAAPVLPIINKVFGNLVYDRSITDYPTENRLFTLEESLNETEKV
jgi:UDP-glucose 4-epimerase